MEQVWLVVDETAGLNWVDVAAAAMIGWSATGQLVAVHKTTATATVAMLVHKPSYLLFLSAGCETNQLFGSFVKKGKKWPKCKEWRFREQVLHRILIYCSDCKDETEFDGLVECADMIFGKKTVVEHHDTWLSWALAHGREATAKTSLSFEDAQSLVSDLAESDLELKISFRKFNRNIVLAGKKAEKMALLSLDAQQHQAFKKELENAKTNYEKTRSSDDPRERASLQRDFTDKVIDTADQLAFSDCCVWHLPASFHCSNLPTCKPDDEVNGECQLCRHRLALNTSLSHVNQQSVMPDWISMLPIHSNYYRPKIHVTSTIDKVQQISGGLTSYDIFISYRWLPHHKPVARALFEWFNCHTANGEVVTEDTPESERVRVFWDQECIGGEKEEAADTFLRAAATAKVFVILVSREVCLCIL
eukprot:COSAG02_NODE_3346_length_6896_cov_18.050611_3_plen_419_part_00